ncbi:polyketide cyclase [Streptomyces sp. NA04227]|uniref:SRPBCC family protein n=1 Tax=Streptomyces sp. NA04227 TaxID=2742136 RepID=UPI0015928C3F|nr:SRPBCC family protein [Streptomyces sp. NA04227]QKW05536.1 polyketide cyclase [Streptomyces sp. NA04227]
MAFTHYRFRSVWTLPVPPGAVYEVLERGEDYPRWWKQVREVIPLDEHSGRARFRSVLPVDLVITAWETRRDPDAGILEIGMAGDLEGWARWTVRGGPGGRGTRAVYEQEVEVRHALMRAFALPGRPFFLVNHALMMRSGRRGLLVHLARLDADGSRD